ncbi:four-carbon acid sugar kinase family protein [Corticibacterium sp. UT-5YL-CI-8]|nr:four-carbon acid sugar kinase family protein [Tianweitania sp. UT-5YL-CI-8]
MTLLAAIVADDLTGALDTSVPFVASGLKVAVAMTPEATERALASQPDILAVNTGSRAASPDDAVDRIRAIAEVLVGSVASSLPHRLEGLATSAHRFASQTASPPFHGGEEPKLDEGCISRGSSSSPLRSGGEAVSPSGKTVRGYGTAPASLSPSTIVLKKIDSRLKGNVAVEAEALANAVGRQSLVVASAVPDQGRYTQDGAVVGRGVDAPLAIKPIFAEVRLPVVVEDAQSDADLDAVIANNNWSDAVAVGARGLGLAFARSLGHPVAKLDTLPSSRSVLFAFGSRDPITVQQMQVLQQNHRAIAVLDAPNGTFGLPGFPTLPLLVRCSGEMTSDAENVAETFAACVLRTVEQLRPETLVMGGGDTALAILGALGADVLFPRGEVAPGLPWFTVAVRHGGEMRCVVKSGGFGTEMVLAEFLSPAPVEQAEAI